MNIYMTSRIIHRDNHLWNEIYEISLIKLLEIFLIAMDDYNLTPVLVELILSVINMKESFLQQSLYY